MANPITSDEAVTVGAAVVRRKPAFTYPSPQQSTALFHLEKTVTTTASAISTSPLAERSQVAELPTRKASRRRMTTPVLPLYHPFGALALSLPDLDPTVFGLPAPVAVLDDPARRSSHRQRRRAAKVRDAEDPATKHAASLVAETPTPETEVREKPSPRRRRGGPGGKRKRKEAEDGDATYPAKRARHPRSLGIGSALSGTRAPSREEGSPALSNAGELAEEKRRERRTTRSRGATTRGVSTASEDTVTSGSPSVSGRTTGARRVRAEAGDKDDGSERGAEAQTDARQENE